MHPWLNVCSIWDVELTSGNGDRAEDIHIRFFMLLVLQTYYYDKSELLLLVLFSFIFP